MERDKTGVATAIAGKSVNDVVARRQRNEGGHQQPANTNLHQRRYLGSGFPDYEKNGQQCATHAERDELWGRVAIEIALNNPVGQTCNRGQDK